MMRIRKNDNVVVLTGKDKGKRGSVLVIDNKTGKVLVKGVAIVTRHVKPRRTGQTGGIKKEEAFIHMSNVMPVCPSCDKPCRVNVKTADGTVNKVRICNRCSAAL
jgi:large subunit ribosomal protein L24